MTTTNGPDAEENPLTRAMSGRAPAKPVEPPIPRVDLNQPRHHTPWRLVSAVLAAALVVVGAIAFMATRKDPQPATATPAVSTEEGDLKAANSAYGKYLKAETQAYFKYRPSIVQPYLEDDAYYDVNSFILGLKKDKIRLVGSFSGRIISSKWSDNDGTRTVTMAVCENTGSQKLLDQHGKNQMVGPDGKSLPAHQKVLQVMQSSHGQPWRLTKDYKILANKC